MREIIKRIISEELYNYARRFDKEVFEIICEEDFLIIEGYKIEYSDFYNNDSNINENTIINAVYFYVNLLSNKNKLLLSAFFNDLNCEDYKLNQYILSDLNSKCGIFEINTYVNEFKKEICYIMLLKQESLLVNIDKKDINSCNSVDEYLKLRDLKKKINNF